MKNGFCIILFLLLRTSLLLAADVKFIATLSKGQVGVGEQFEVDFTVSGTASHFIGPDFSAFQIVSGPNLSFSNDGTTQNTTYAYIISAVKEGTFTITAAAIVVNGHTMLSNQLKIKVQGQAPPQSLQTQVPQEATVHKDDNAQDNPNDLSKLLFLKTDVTKTNVYVGEQIIVKYKVYTRADIEGGVPDKAPDLNGFWSQDIVSKNKAATWSLETYKGVKYSVAVIKQTVIFPEHAGNLIVDPLSMTFVIRRRLPPRKLLNNAYGNYEEIKYQVKSPPVIIHAAPLPAAGKPADFSGAVGSFSLYTDIDKKELKANETFNYTFEVRGSGNLSLINAPKITPPLDFEKYDPKTTDRITVDSTGITGSRQFNYLLIPRHHGNYVLDLAKFSYFDPRTGRYVTLPVNTFNIKVGKGDVQVNVPVFNSADQQDIKMLGNDIRYIKTSSVLSKDEIGFYGMLSYYAWLLFSPLLIVVAFFYRKWRINYNSDAVLVKSRKANKIASQRMGAAQREMAAGNREAFFEEVAKGLYGYLSDKLNIPIAQLNKENIAETLRARSVTDLVIHKLNDTIDHCEMARFAPEADLSQQQIFENAKNVIHEIEKEL